MATAIPQTLVTHPAGVSSAMSWKEHNKVDRREAFIRARMKGEQTMAELCREFGVSRKTGYKWEQRYLDGGEANLVDRASRPHSRSRITPAEMTQRIVAVRATHPTWGPTKIAQKLVRENPSLELPAISTIAAILKREGLIKPRRPRQRTPQSTFHVAAATAPNVVWSAAKLCRTLIITDVATRTVLREEPLASERMETYMQAFANAFKEFGLPLRIRSDDRWPFVTTAIAGLSALSIWWIKLGILPERAPPQIARTHETSRYSPSPRSYDEQLRDPEYPSHFETCRVDADSCIELQQQRVAISKLLRRERLGVEPIEDDLWHLWFGPVFLGRLRQHAGSKLELQK